MAENVRASYPFVELKQVDLGYFEETLQHLLAEPSTDTEFLDGLETRIAYLKDGHTRIERTDLPPQAVPVVRWRFVGETPCVAAASNIVPVPLGDCLSEVDGRPVDSALEEGKTQVEASNHYMRREAATYRMLRGPVGSRMTARFEQSGSVLLDRLGGSGRGGGRPEGRLLDGDIAYIRVHTFLYMDDVDDFDRLVNQYLDARGMIIDLRGNGGGNTGMADAMLGRLIRDPRPGFELVTRDGDRSRGLGPYERGDLYDGPLVVITGPFTYSAANYFVHQLRYNHRAITVGEATGGGAGVPDIRFELVEGMFFQVSGRIVQSPEGEHTEQGISPTIGVRFTPDDLALGRDLVWGEPTTDKTLDRAIQAIVEMGEPQK